MILVDNINFLRKRFNKIRVQLTNCNDTDINSEAMVCDAKNGELTLLVNKNENWMSIHSKYSPGIEATRFVEKFKKVIQEYDHVFFYGIGLGYHIEALMNEFPSKQFTLYEPSKSVMYQCFSHLDIKKLPTARIKYLYLEESIDGQVEFLRHFFENEDGNILLVVLPSYKQIYEEQYITFEENFKKSLKEKKSGLQSNLAFEKRWTINSVINLSKILETPNILHDLDTNKFKGKTAVLVAAGPSLNEEIDNIKEIKDKGLAYIFSVGSAINTLVEHGIHPHAACTYDPKKENQNVFKKIIDQNINTIPLIFGSSVGFETIQNYPGKMLHMLTSQDTVAPFYLKKTNVEKINFVYDAPSIAVITLQLLCKLGFDTIILVGQNLAYLNNKQYAKGIDYHREKVNIDEVQNLVVVKDVYGNDVYASESFNNMRRVFERHIKANKQTKVINTTRGGANIEGTTFKTLKSLIQEKLTDSIVEEDWLNPKSDYGYDAEYLINQAKKMEKAYHEVSILVESLNKGVQELENLLTGNNARRLETSMVNLDKLIDRLSNNFYFTTLLLPMNRVSFSVFSKDLQGCRAEIGIIKKAEKVVQAYTKFLSNCINSFKDTEKLFTLMHYTIKNKYPNFNSKLEAKFAQELIIQQNPSENSKEINTLSIALLDDPNLLIKYDVKALIAKQYLSGTIFNRMDMIVRYLVIEQYYGKNNFGYNLYEKMQKKRGQNVHNLDRFLKLIKSIEEHGFSENFAIIVDQNLQLIDGSHRLACALYFGITNIPIQIIEHNANVLYSIDWFEKNGFSKKEIEIITYTKNEIFKEKALYFSCVLWSPVNSFFDEITSSLNSKFNVISAEDYKFDNTNEYVANIKGLYAVDDIESWKINKKISFMEKYPRCFRMITLEIGDPKYRKKTQNGKPISIVVEEIKKEIRAEYSRKIDKYFYDIIMHIGDNFEHTEHMGKILRKNIDIRQFLLSIKDYNYALTKIDVPYMPDNFPNDYPLSKDLDIICAINDFNNIKEKAKVFSKQYKGYYDIKNIEENNKFRLRFELNGFLCYQIDVSYDIKGVFYFDLEKALTRKLSNEIFYSFTLEDEILLRTNEFEDNPNKIHHLSFVAKNKDVLIKLIEKRSVNKEKIKSPIKNLLKDSDSSILGERFKPDGIESIILDNERKTTKEIVRTKIRNQDYKLELINCRICNGREFDRLANKERNGIEMATSICRNCGTVQTNPRLIQKSLTDFYNYEFNQLFRNNLSPDEYFRVQYNRGKNLHNFLVKNNCFSFENKKLSILEVGCGIGGIIKYFKDQGHLIKGVDLGKHYIDIGREKYGLDLEVGTIEDLNPTNQYDIIIYRHVLEHVLEPVNELHSINKYLKDKGIVYIEVPGIKALNHTYNKDFLQYLMLSHVYHYSLTSLKNLFIQDSFELIYGNEQIEAVFQKVNGKSVITSIENDYESVLNLLNKLEVLRK